MALKLKAYRVSKENLNKNKFPSSYTDLVDNITQITPVKIRKIESYAYHIAEDVKGDIFLLDDYTVTSNKLYQRNVGISESTYLLDSVGKFQIKASKQQESSRQENKVVIESNEEDLNNLPEVKIIDIDLNENSEQESENTGETND